MTEILSRKKFLKISGLSAIALGSGFSLGKLLPDNFAHRFAIYGYLPSSEKIIKKVVKAFIKRSYEETAPTILAEDYYKGLIKQLYKTSASFSLFNNYSVTYRITRLNKPLDSDIIISDSRKSIYSLHNDFSSELLNIRSEIKSFKASLFFSAEYNQTGIFSSLFNSQQKSVIIENENGITDKIPLNSSYKNITVKGKFGKTKIELKNNLVRIIESSCRHKLCEKAGSAAIPGDIIACAPNKLLIRIEAT